MVNELSLGGWQNSDLWNETEELLEKIAEHLKNCKGCAKNFQRQTLPIENLFEIENMLSQNPDLSDWICNAFTWTDEEEKQLRILRAKKARIKRNMNRTRRFKPRGLKLPPTVKTYEGLI